MITLHIMLWLTAAWERNAVAMASYGADTGIGVLEILKDLDEKKIMSSITVRNKNISFSKHLAYPTFSWSRRF